jgi:cell wall assembly regulator SMI1
MFIERPIARSAAPVAASWQRLDRWYKTHAPEVIESLRPGASEQEISAIEKESGVQLPDSLRQSYMVHDGENDMAYPGAIIGVPYDPVDSIPYKTQSSRKWLEKYDSSDTDFEGDRGCTSVPPDAIRRRCFSSSLIAICYRDGACIGIDLDPGPNGVPGQVVNFGNDLDEWRFVLAVSWGHFLEDIADELEAGNLVITREADGTVGGFGRASNADQSILSFCDEWSKAKLPAAFQEAKAVTGVPVFLGSVVTGEVARIARALVDGFIRAMHQFETAWLNVRPINQLGYIWLDDRGPLGFGGHPQGMGPLIPRMADLDYERSVSAQKSIKVDLLKTIQALQGGSFREKAMQMAVRVNQAADKLQIGVHNDKAVREYRAILKQYCTGRKRANDGHFIQVYPPYYDPANDRVAEVRQVSNEKLLVYMEPASGAVVRYHLLLSNQHWLIDYKDVTTDHVTFYKSPLLFGDK